MKLQILLVALACACCHDSRAQVSTYEVKFELSKKNFVDSIEIEYEHERVYVPVIINGKRHRFLLDTGAGHAVVYSDRPIEGCETVGTIASHDAIGRTDTVEVVKLPPLTLGTLTLTGCRATVQHRVVRRSSIDGIIGFDLVNRGLLMKIDVRRHLLVLTDQRKLFNGEQGYKTKYRLNYHVPFLKIEPFKGYREQVLFDTGSRQLYAMNKAHFDAAESFCMKQNRQQIEGRGMGRHAIGFLGTEPRGEVVFLAIDSLTWGGFAFRDVHTQTTQGGSHLGAKILEYGAVIFNPKKKQAIFQPYESQQNCQVGNAQLQKAIINEGGLPVVGLVWERSEPYEAGLREGDTLLKADGQPIGSFNDYLKFRPLRGRVYNFTVRDRRGFLKEVRMKW